jgi:shikimate kinase
VGHPGSRRLASPIASIVYLLGYPGVGKYTVARELAKLNGAVVVDNHVVNHPILVLLKWDAISSLPPGTLGRTAPIRDAVLSAIDEIAPREISYVLTNVLLDNEEDRAIYDRVTAIAARRGSVFLPVLLNCERDEQLRRVQSEERAALLKVADPQAVERLMESTQLLVPDDANLLRLDTTVLDPAEAAARIARRAAEGR